jgi:hypothetical protein
MKITLVMFTRALRKANIPKILEARPPMLEMTSSTVVVVLVILCSVLLATIMRFRNSLPVTTRAG